MNMKKLLLLIFALLLFEGGKLSAQTYSIFYHQGNDWIKLCELTDDDEDGVYTAIINFEDKSLLTWGLCQIQLFSGTAIESEWSNAIWTKSTEVTSDNYNVFSKSYFTLSPTFSTNNKLAIPITNSDPDTYAVQVEYTASTKEIKFTKLIEFASSDDDWHTSNPVYLEETEHGSKIFKKELSLNASIGYKFVGNNGGSVGWYGKSGSDINTSGSDMTISEAGSYEITANFSTNKYTAPDCKSIAATITTNKYATFSSNQKLDFTGTGITLYKATSANSSSVHLEEVSGIVEHNNGLLLYSETAKTYQIPVSTEDATAKLDGNKLQSTATEAHNIAAGEVGRAFVFGKLDKEVGFFKAGEGKTIAVNKCYLLLDSEPTSKDVEFLSLGFDEEEQETNGINAVRLNTDNGIVYNLAGQRVSKDYKGIVIVNGKKMLNK